MFKRRSKTLKHAPFGKKLIIRILLYTTFVVSALLAIFVGHSRKLFISSSVTASTKNVNTNKQKRGQVEKVKEDEEYKKFEFPYPKSCQFERPPPGHGTDYDIAIFYHVGFINNWKTIMWDQMHTLETCGLGYMASNMTISYYSSMDDSTTTTTVAELVELVKQFRFTENLQTITYMQATSSPFEKPILESAGELCRSNKIASPKKRTFIYYFHSKGASQFTEDWRLKCYQDSAYCNILYWRKYLEFFLIEKPTLCLEAFLENDAYTCGVNLHNEPSWHYNGNFWAASCDYVSRLPAKIETSEEHWTNHVAAEMWIGKQIPYIGNINLAKYISFFESDTLHLPEGEDFWKGTLYSNPLNPEIYGNISSHIQKTNMYSNIWLKYLDALNK